LSSTLTIAGHAFKDAITAKWLIIFAILFFLLAINLPEIYMADAGYLPPNYLSAFVPDLIALSFPFIPLLALPMGSPSIVDEKESGTLQFVLSNPIKRSEFFAGKYLGLLAATSVVVAGGFGISAVVTYGTNLALYGQIFTVILVAGLLNLVMLGIALAISVRIKRKITALTAGIFAWFLFAVVSNYNLLGSTLATSRQLNLGTFLVLLNPIESSEILTLLRLKASYGQLGISGLIVINTLGQYTQTILLVSLLVWAAVLTTVCFLFFVRQDAV
jgi:ABC-type transport system involved in multi-copper enzyme maturation permease subunit